MRSVNFNCLSILPEHPWPPRRRANPAPRCHRGSCWGRRCLPSWSEPVWGGQWWSWHSSTCCPLTWSDSTESILLEAASFRRDEAGKSVFCSSRHCYMAEKISLCVSRHMEAQPPRASCTLGTPHWRHVTLNICYSIETSYLDNGTRTSFRQQPDTDLRRPKVAKVLEAGLSNHAIWMQALQCIQQGLSLLFREPCTSTVMVMPAPVRTWSQQLFPFIFMHLSIATCFCFDLCERASERGCVSRELVLRCCAANRSELQRVVRLLFDEKIRTSPDKVIISLQSIFNAVFLECREAITFMTPSTRKNTGKWRRESETSPRRPMMM